MEKTSSIARTNYLLRPSSAAALLPLAKRLVALGDGGQSARPSPVAAEKWNVCRCRQYVRHYHRLVVVVVVVERGRQQQSSDDVQEEANLGGRCRTVDPSRTRQESSQAIQDDRAEQLVARNDDSNAEIPRRTRSSSTWIWQSDLLRYNYYLEKESGGIDNA
jgi:hypothetical protein